MSGFLNPFDGRYRLAGGCSCGRHASAAEHEAAQTQALPASEDAALERTIESAVMRALFPRDGERRRFLSAVGAGTAAAALSGLFPVGAAKALAADTNAPLEKKKPGVAPGPAMRLNVTPAPCSKGWRTSASMSVCQTLGKRLLGLLL